MQFSPIFNKFGIILISNFEKRLQSKDLDN